MALRLLRLGDEDQVSSGLLPNPRCVPCLAWRRGHAIGQRVDGVDPDLLAVLLGREIHERRALPLAARAGEVLLGQPVAAGRDLVAPALELGRERVELIARGLLAENPRSARGGHPGVDGPAATATDGRDEELGSRELLLTPPARRTDCAATSPVAPAV